MTNYWAFRSKPHDKHELPPKISYYIKTFHLRGGFGWRLLGNFGEEYAKGWAKRKMVARKAAEDAKKQIEEREQKLREQKTELQLK
jgi:hypothetical protein